jgi:hypothetical protein
MRSSLGDTDRFQPIVDVMRASIAANTNFVVSYSAFV